MRHAKAEPYGDQDYDRPLTRRGRRDAARSGRFLAEAGIVPDYALVSAARRCRETWEQVRDAASAEAHEEVTEALFGATPIEAVEALRRVSDGFRTVLYVGHNPTVTSLAQLIDDGDGDVEALRGLLSGFPPAALAVFELRGGFPELTEGTARLTQFHHPDR